MGLLTIENRALRARFNPANHQLCSLLHEGREVLHDGGMPADLREQPRHPADWPNTEFVMLPPGKARDGVYVAGKRKSDRYAIGQHGVPRHKQWTLESVTPHCVKYVMEHRAHDIVYNQKLKPHNDRDTMMWPYSFRLEKEHALLPNALVSLFKLTNLNARPMPYAIGWHPAFAIPATGLSLEVPGAERYASIPEDMNRGVLDTHAIITTNHYTIDFTSDFGRLHLWRPKDAPFACVEPVTAPMLAEGYTTLLPPHGKILEPGASVVYNATIRFVDK